MLYLVFVFGLIAGSFLNVVIYRLKSGEPIGLGRSFCPDCRTQLRWYDLVPVLSFLWLRGHCRYCNKKISRQYPVVEILSGLIWVGVFYKVFGSLGFEIWDFFRLPAEASAQAGISDFGFRILDSIYYILIFSALLVIAVYDFKWRIIPDKIVYPAIAVALIFNLFNFFKSLNIETFKLLNFEIFILPLFIASIASIAFLFFFLIFYFSKGRAMGLGDAKLAFLIGLFLSPLPSVVAFTLSFVIGAAFGIILVGLGKIFPDYRKWGMKSQIAFGPFLVLGAFIAFFFSDFILKLLNY